MLSSTLIIMLFTNSLGHLEKPCPSRGTSYCCRNVPELYGQALPRKGAAIQISSKEEHRAYLEALKEGSSAKEKAEVEFDDQMTDYSNGISRTTSKPNSGSWPLGLRNFKTVVAQCHSLNPCCNMKPFLGRHMGVNYSAVSWRERWKQIIQGGHSICFKFVWLHSQYEQSKPFWPFSDD